MLLALVLGAVAVAVATSSGDQAELVAPDSLVTDTELTDTEQPPVTEPPVTEPPVTEPPVEPPAAEPPPAEPEPAPPAEPPVEPPVAEPPVADLIAGFAATDDLGVFLEQVERNPDLVGEKGDDLAEDLRDVLEARGGRQRKDAGELREELAEWVEDGEIDPVIAAALDALLAPIADG